MPDTMTFDEISALLARPADLERTVEYVRRRRCRPYPPFGGKPQEELLPGIREHERQCFTCNEHKPEHQGTCWGNASCEIWNCQDCVPRVLWAVARAEEAEQAQQEQEAR